MLLELDDELEVLSSLLPHFPTAKSRTKIPMTINATLPLKLFFVAVAVAVGAWDAAHPWPSQYLCRPDPDGSGYHPGGVGAVKVSPVDRTFLCAARLADRTDKRSHLVD